MVRLPEAEIAAVKKQGVRDFEPMAGHKMGGYVIVPGDSRAKPAPAVALIKKALAHTRAMPAKAPKKKAIWTRSLTVPNLGGDLSSGVRQTPQPSSRIRNRPRSCP